MPSAFDDADPAVLRGMLGIGGILLAEIASETDSVSILQDLAGSLRDFLDAVEVRLVVSGEAAEFGAHWSVIADENGVRPPDPDELANLVAGSTHHPARHHVDIESSLGEPLAVLSVAWSDHNGARPTELDRLIVSRFANMGFVILERYLARRRQLRAVARERQVIAGDLHDDPIQTMTAVSLRLQRLTNRFEPGDDRDQIETVRELADEAIERLRHVMYSVYPETLDEDGLVAALNGYCETYLDDVGPEWIIEDQLGDEPPEDIAMLAFRLVRNAVANVVDHASATTVTINVSSPTDRRLLITVTDDGIGFDTTATIHTPVGHFGNPHAHTLALWAGGTHTVTSSPGSGTRVVIDLPVA